MKRLQEGLTADPKNMVLLVNLAELQERQNQPLEAVRATLTSAIAASPNAPEPRLRLIAYAVRKRLYKEALAAAQEALVSMPGDAQILQAAGRAQLQGGDVEQAASTFRRLATVSTASPQPYVSLADVYRTAGDLDKAESALTKALEIDPSFVPARAALIDIFTRADRQKHAEEYIARLRSAKPKDPYTYVLDSGFRARQQDFEGAISALRQGLALSNSPDLAVRLYVALIQAKRGPEAARFGADWLRKHPNDLELEYAMSNADMNRGDFALAEQKLKRVVSGMPNNAAALNNLAWVVLNRKGEGAVVYARRALEIAPERTDFMDTLALALGAENQAAAAVAVQRKAVELAPADNRLRLTLARLAAQAGDKTLARQELTRLQSLGAAFQAQAEVAQLLQQL
jgi:putative PEP-CTERM system TPR-repeat lipoprotein